MYQSVSKWPFRFMLIKLASTKLGMMILRSTTNMSEPWLENLTIRSKSIKLEQVYFPNDGGITGKATFT